MKKLNFIANTRRNQYTKEVVHADEDYESVLYCWAEFNVKCNKVWKDGGFMESKGCGRTDSGTMVCIFRVWDRKGDEWQKGEVILVDNDVKLRERL